MPQGVRRASHECGGHGTSLTVLTCVCQRIANPIARSRLVSVTSWTRNRSIYPVTPNGLIGASALLLVELVALVGGRRAVAGVAHAHAPAAQHQTLEQRVAFEYGSTTVLGARGAVTPHYPVRVVTAGPKAKACYHEIVRPELGVVDIAVCLWSGDRQLQRAFGPGGRSCGASPSWTGGISGL